MGGLKDALSKTLNPDMEIGGYFRLIDKLGQGGFGEVWKAQDRRSGDVVALKMPHHQFALSPKVVDSLREECKVLKTLSHPNICRLLDLENDPDYGPLLITEYVEGTDLWKASRNLNWEALIEVLVGVLHGLAYLHGQKIMHLDLKPANILVGPSGPKLIDFGLASFTSPEHFSGTLPYAAPETVLHQKRGLSADLYSLGIVMYECLAGINPFRCTNPDETKKLQKEWMPPPPTKHRDGIPAWLSGLVMQMLEKNPEKRCTISEVLRAIRVAHDTASHSDQAHVQSFAAASGKFVGRTDIVQTIHSSLTATATPKTVHTVIEGAMGTGKTRLLNEFKFDAKILGLQTIVVASAADATPFALEIIAEALSSERSPVLLLIDDFDQWGRQVPALGALIEILRVHPHPPTWVGCIMTVSHNSDEKPDVMLRPFTVNEVSDYLLAVAPIPDGPRMQLVNQIVAQTGGNPRRVAELMERMVKRNYFASDSGQWDASLFEDVTVEVSEVFSEQAPVTSPGTLVEICRNERREGHPARALEGITQYFNAASNSSKDGVLQLLVEAAECALACGRVKDALQLMERIECNDDGSVLFWKGILLTALRRLPEARSTLKSAQDSAGAHGDEVLEVRIANQLARCDLVDGNYNAAIAAYHAAAERANKLTQEQQQKITNNELGYALLMKGAYNEALPILQDYARYCEAAHHVRRNFNTIVQVGDCYAKMNDIQKAADAYVQVIFKAREAQQIDILSHAYNQLGKLQFEHNILDEAMVTLKRAIAINHMIGDLSSVAVNTTNLGLSQLRAGLSSEAKTNLETAKAFFARCLDGVQRTLVPCLIGLGEISKQEHQKNKGITFLNEAIDLANKHDIYLVYQDALQTTLKEINEL